METIISNAYSSKASSKQVIINIIWNKISRLHKKRQQESKKNYISYESKEINGDVQVT